MKPANAIESLGYPSIVAMCKGEGINRDTFRKVRAKNPTLSTSDIVKICKEKKGLTRVLGFPNAKYLCKHYNISYQKWRDCSYRFKDIPAQERLDAILKGIAPACWTGGKTEGTYVDERLLIKPVKKGFYVFDMKEQNEGDSEYYQKSSHFHGRYNFRYAFQCDF